MNNDEIIEIDIESELLEKIRLIANKQGLSPEEYISGILDCFIKNGMKY